MFKKILFLMMIVFISFFIHIDTARAAPQLEVKAEIGVANIIKFYTPFPIKLTITNNGVSFSGDLVIDAAVTYSAGSAQVYPLDLPEGETKTLLFIWMVYQKIIIIAHKMKALLFMKAELKRGNN